MALPNTPLPPILGGLAINMVQIGTTVPPLPNTGRNCYASNLKGGFLYGDAFFYNNTLTQNAYYSQWGMQGFRIKKDGTNCMLMDFANLAAGGLQFNPYGPNLFQIGPANFLMTGSGGGPIVQYNIADQFQNGSTINTPVSSESIPSPCGVGSLHSTFYSSSQNLVAYEFVQPFEVNSNIYASIYDIGPNGQSVVNSGYVGNVAPGQSCFDLTSQSLPPYISSTYQNGTSQGNLAFQGGNSFYFSGSFAVPYYLGATGLQIVQDNQPLVCNQNVPNAGTYVTTTNAFTWPNSLLQTSSAWNKYWSDGSNSYNTSMSENPNIFVMPINNGNWLMVFSQFFIVLFQLNVNIQTCVLFSDGTLIGLGSSSGVRGNEGFAIYKGEIPLSEYGLILPPKIYFEGQGTANINYTRPISLRGAFKA